MIGSIVFVDPPAPISVANVGFSGYSFNGGSTNPTLSLQKGLTYTFNVNSPGHPFRIVGDTTTSFPQASYNALADCTSCVTGADATSGAVTFAVPTNPTATNVGYICIYHSQSAGVVQGALIAYLSTLLRHSFPQ